MWGSKNCHRYLKERNICVTKSHHFHKIMHLSEQIVKKVGSNFSKNNYILKIFLTEMSKIINMHCNRYLMSTFCGDIYFTFLGNSFFCYYFPREIIKI